MNLVKKITTWVFVLIILILGISFTLLNPGFIGVNLGFKVFNIPLVLVMLMPFAFGLLLGLLIGFSRAFFIMRRKKDEEVALKIMK